MKKAFVAHLTAVTIALGCTTMAAAEQKTPTAEKQKSSITEKKKTEATAEVAAALKQLLAEVQALLTKENVHSMYDRPRLLKETGVTYQPDLVVASDLTPRLSSCNLRIYAGIKMYDAVYAAVFNKKQEVARSLQAIDAAMIKLDLRSHADFSGHIRDTVRKVASETGEVDIRQMLNQLTADTIQELPVFMSSSESAHFLMDCLYGFALEACSVMGYFHQTDPNDRLMKLRTQQPAFLGWLNAVDNVFGAFQKSNQDLRVECKRSHSPEFIKTVMKLSEAERSGKITTKEARQQLAGLREQLTQLRASILADGK